MLCFIFVCPSLLIFLSLCIFVFAFVFVFERQWCRRVISGQVPICCCPPTARQAPCVSQTAQSMIAHFLFFYHLFLHIFTFLTLQAQVDDKMALYSNCHMVSLLTICLVLVSAAQQPILCSSKRWEEVVITNSCSRQWAPSVNFKWLWRCVVGRYPSRRVWNSHFIANLKTPTYKQPLQNRPTSVPCSV